MTALAVGGKVRVHHEDGFKYILHVEVMKICPPNEFMGRVESVFANSPERGEVGEMTGGEILALKGKERRFKSEDIV